METGLVCAGGAPQQLIEVAQRAEAQGFASLWVPEHVVTFDDYASRYPYAATGKAPMTGDMPMLEPLNLLAFLAAATERIRLGTGVFLLPQRNPVYTAKQVATLDYLSGGRVDLGIGVGWCSEEFAAADVPFEARGARCDEYIEILRRLWTEPVAEFEGRFYQLPACRQEPKPVQSPHPPIIVGGVTDAALRRAARLGDGWLGINLSLEQASERLEHLRELLAAQDRSLADLQISLQFVFYPIEPDDLPRYRDLGVDQIVLTPSIDGRLPASHAELLQSVDALAKSHAERARHL